MDLTPYLDVGGRNQLAIRLDNPPESARWYPGGGLYRDVWLTVTDPVHVAQWGTHVTTADVSVKAATVDLRVDVANDGAHAARVQVASEIFALDEAGRPTGKAIARIAPQALDIAAGGSARAQSSVRIDHPRLWGPPPTQQPHRHVAITTVSRDGKVVDRYQTRFGIRELRFDPQRGVSVNGEAVRLQGVNQHHDLGALGAAFNVRAAERQLEILRGMGVNAIRLGPQPARSAAAGTDRPHGFWWSTRCSILGTQEDAAGFPPRLPRVARGRPARDGAPRPQPSLGDHVERRQRGRRAVHRRGRRGDRPQAQRDGA